ncbi:MAG: excisionase family DNA-binding protein [Verrucomicrobiae bacterium]|nr:excisionase family DNA-binding protein [Verrucomicrobiae bacterium]
MTTTEAGKLIGGYSKFTVIRLIEAGKLEAIRTKPGGHYRITNEAVQEFKKRFTIKCTAFGKEKCATN